MLPLRRSVMFWMGVWILMAAFGCAGVRPAASGTDTDTDTGGGTGTGGLSGGAGEFPGPAPDGGCMNILSLGKVAHYGGNSDSTDAFQQYLNSKSTARMTLSTDRTTLTRERLAGYDLVILQALEDSEYTGFWTYGQDEVDALADWVRAGHALVALTGYGSNPDEVQAANQLLAFAGIAYGKSDTFASCPDNYCYCTDSSVPFRGWSPGSFLGEHMAARNGAPGAVGVFHGRPITCDDAAGGPCQPVASDPAAGMVGVAKQVGNGRVFVWSDEWVTYTSQWGAANTHGPDCAGRTAGEVYDVPQFWYNAIHWLLPGASCFSIADPVIVID
jgi:hypothetical protein